MTDKFTMEQKIERLQELMKSCNRGRYDRKLASAWLNLVRDYQTKEAFTYVYREYSDEAEKTWDVHTGIAFSPLYDLL